MKDSLDLEFLVIFLQKVRALVDWPCGEMATQQPNQSILTLRAITYRISSTPTKQLPQIVQQISGSLWTCKDLLSTPQQTSKANSESSTLLHRFRTSLSSLLQDRTIEGRWAGVVLVKAAVEAGGLETLSKPSNWIKSLLGILKKPDPPTTRSLVTIILTRIFILTWDHPSLVREITTPNLPTFVSLCLSNAENRKRFSSSEIKNVLEAFTVLLPRHPTIFRNHQTAIRTLLIKILSSSSSGVAATAHYTQAHKATVQRLLVLLHHCAPNQSAAEKWRETVQATISSAHVTCDTLFRSIVEDTSSGDALRQNNITTTTSTGEIGSDSQDGLGLHPWRGIFEGTERLLTLLGVLERHIDSSTASTVAIPVGSLVDLMARLFNVTIPTPNSSLSVKANPQIPKDERDLLYTVLPEIHAAALTLVGIMVDQFGAALVAVVQPLLERITDIFDGEKTYTDIRTETYETLSKILGLIGPSLSKEDIAELTSIIKSCCDDLLPHELQRVSAKNTNINGVKPRESGQIGDTTLPSSNLIASHPTKLTDLRHAAKSLLVILISKIDAAHMPRKLRVRMERTAIFLKDRETLVACVLNPAKNASGTAAQTSLLPLLARLFRESNEVEALLRPRMPIVFSGNNDREADAEMLEGEEKGVANGASDGTDGDLPEDVNDEEDLYAASPRLQSAAAAMSQETSFDLNPPDEVESASKRPAIEPLDDIHTAKRVRAMPLAQDSTAEAPAAPEVQTPSPEDAMAEGPQNLPEISQQKVDAMELPTATIDKKTALTYHVASNVVDNFMDESDDSDIEVPPLTMESDTEPDEDDDDD